jgi:hypothetical protein
MMKKKNWDLAQSLPPSCPRAIHLPRQREAKQYLLLSHSKPLRKSAILNNFVWFHDMPPSDEGGGNRKVDGGRDNAKQKFIKLHETALICSNPNSRSSPSAVFTAFSPWKHAFSPIYKTAQNKKQYFVKFKRK